MSFVFKKYLRIGFAVLSGVSLGLLRIAPIIRDQKIATEYVDSVVTIEATVVDTPEMEKRQYKLRLGSLRINNSINTLNCQVYAIVGQGAPENISRSDRIVLRGKLQPGFSNYQGALYRPAFLALSKPDPPDYASIIRTWFVTRVRQLFDDDEAANLALGYLIGDRSLTDTFKEQLRLVGLSHIVVASGFCLSVIVDFIKKRIGKYSHFLGTFATAALMLAFLSLTGISPSLLRAGVVSGLVLWASHFGRRFHPVRLLLYSAAISGLYNPMIYAEVAWQLSYASYAGIILISPLIGHLLYGKRSSGFLADSLIVTFSAQLACIPLSIYYFGAFSVLGFLANLLVAPTIPHVMLMTFCGGILPLPQPFIFAAKLLTRIHIFVIDQLSRLPWIAASLDTGHPQIFLVYPILLALGILITRLTKYSYKPKLAKEDN